MTRQGSASRGQCGSVAAKALALTLGCIGSETYAAGQVAAPRDAQASAPGVAASQQPNTASNDITGLGPSEPAQAEARDTLVVKVEVKLPTDCGTSAEFLERLRSRLRDVRFAEQGATHALRAEVVGVAKLGYRATMTLTFPDGHAASRGVHASDCNDAAEALALIAAVAIDPSNADLSPMPRAARDHPVANGPSTLETRYPQDAARPAGPLTDPAVVTAVPAASKPASKRMLGIGAAGAAYVGVSPTWLTGVDLSFRLGQQRRNGFAPAIRLAVGYAAERGVEAVGGVADFHLLSTQLDVCGWQALLSAVELRACGLVHTGILTASGRATDAPQSRHRPLMGFGTALELVLLPHARWGLPVRFQGFIPTTRDVFAFDPKAFHRVSSILFGATAGVEMRFQ